MNEKNANRLWGLCRVGLWGYGELSCCRTITDFHLNGLLSGRPLEGTTNEYICIGATYFLTLVSALGIIDGAINVFNGKESYLLRGLRNVGKELKESLEKEASNI